MSTSTEGKSDLNGEQQSEHGREADGADDGHHYVMLYPGSKKPVGKNWGEHPLTWAEVVRELEKNPRANVGRLLGPGHGIDVEADGEAAEAAAEKYLGHLRTPTWKATRGTHRLGAHDPRLSHLPASIKVEALGGLEFRRVLNYCKQHGLKVAGVREHDTYGTIIDLCQCCFKGAEHTDGNPAIFVTPDGHYAWHCFHAKCCDRTFADIEMSFGPVIPTITLTTDQSQSVEAGLQALSCEDNVYQHNGELVEVIQEAPKPEESQRDNGSPKLRSIPTTKLKTILSSCVKWQKYNVKREEFVRCVPTMEVARTIEENGEYGVVPVIDGIACCPIITAKGEIIAKKGYDLKTGTYLDVDDGYPPIMGVKEALEALNDVICDFPFAKPEHKSAFYSGLLSLLGRNAYPGRTPFHLVEANVSRAGKGLLTDVWTLIIEGRQASRQPIDTSDDPEMRKLITSVAKSGRRLLLLDNLDGELKLPSLEAALTGETWSDRILGSNNEIEVSLNFMIAATANNLTMKREDMVGRTVRCRLEAPEEDPSKRTGFRHPNLVAYVLRERKTLVMAGLSILHHYIRAGRPDVKLKGKGWGGFQGWSDLIRSALVWAGLPDPDTRDELREDASDETDTLRKLMQAWTELGGASTVSKALKAAEDGKPPLLQEILTTFRGDKSDELGKLLRKYRRRVLDGQKLDHGGEKPVVQWRVVGLA